MEVYTPCFWYLYTLTLFIGAAGLGSTWWGSNKNIQWKSSIKNQISSLNHIHPTCMWTPNASKLKIIQIYCHRMWHCKLNLICDSCYIVQRFYCPSTPQPSQKRSSGRVCLLISWHFDKHLLDVQLKMTMSNHSFVQSF